MRGFINNVLYAVSVATLTVVAVAALYAFVP
jgi:hypothetical protein